MELYEYLGRWTTVMDLPELYRVLNTLINSGKSFEPSPIRVFRAFNLCKYEEVRAVFIGQDPYPQKGVATGILFGNESSEISPSLSIIKESVINYSIPRDREVIFDNTLESWSRQGILMLNSALTTETNNIGSHTMLWRAFISSFLHKLSHTSVGLVFVLFGEQAQTFIPYINTKCNTILKEKHPSFYSRINQPMPSRIFKSVNDILYSQNGDKIKWFEEYGK